MNLLERFEVLEDPRDIRGNLACWMQLQTPSKIRAAEFFKPVFNGLLSVLRTQKI